MKNWEKTRIAKIKGTWQEVVDDCRFTVGKERLGKKPSEAFRRAILMAEHSPIRALVVKWRWLAMPYWVSVHWVRHKWECFVKSQRTDRTGTDRAKLPQDAPVDFTGEANAQHLIDSWRKRLCRKASPETRAYAEDFKLALHKWEPELADVLVPNCIYRGGCPEMQTCGYWAQLMARTDGLILVDDLQNRYDIFNQIFKEAHGND